MWRSHDTVPMYLYILIRKSQTSKCSPTFMKYTYTHSPTYEYIELLGFASTCCEYHSSIK